MLKLSTRSKEAMAQYPEQYARARDQLYRFRRVDLEPLCEQCLDAGYLVSRTEPGETPSTVLCDCDLAIWVRIVAGSDRWASTASRDGFRPVTRHAEIRSASRDEIVTDDDIAIARQLLEQAMGGEIELSQLDAPPRAMTIAGVDLVREAAYRRIARIEDGAIRVARGGWQHVTDIAIRTRS